ncbi:beta-Ig-H3/fasciclin [Streptomyces sp. NPDC003077]|uniref:beta-Ig-H3/fasciclin n=1 Tax=Streptomyces sp. NPDC003077 TaxID=3154443 RepID=UPI0033B92636
MPATASAASAGVMAGGTAPSCIQRYVHGEGATLEILLNNYCGRTMRVQVVISGDSDSPCFTMRDGTRKLWRYSGYGTYDRTAVC